MFNKSVWREFDKKMFQVFGKSIHCVDELYFNVIKENRIGERITFKDEEVLNYLQDLHSMMGELYVITDYCYEHDYGPFMVCSKDLERFVNTFKTVFREPFYSTDIIIVSFEQKLIWVFFHEGMCWVSKG